MSNVTRFGVSLNAELLIAFDALCAKKDYANRSEAIRDLIRQALVEDAWQNDPEIAAAVLTLVYEHHHSSVSKKLTQVQHDALTSVITTLHVHLDHDNCLEVLVLKGSPASIRDLAGRMQAIKGVKHSSLSLATSGPKRI